MLTADELHRRGVEASNHGRVRLAGRLLNRAHERTTDEGLLRRIEASLAYVALETGDPETARRLCEAALARPGLEPGQRGVFLSQLAMVQMRTGDLRAALASFDEGIPRLDVPAELGKARGNRGDVHLHQGRVGAAIDDFAAAARHFEEAGLPVDRAKAEHNLGYARLLGGDLVGALRAMESAYAVLAPVSPVLKAICEQDRAEVLLAAGLTREGTGLLAQASRSYGARGLRQRQAEAELTLARNLQLTDPRGAREAARKARGRFQRLGAAAWQARADAVLLACEVDLGGRAASLLERSDVLEAELDEQGLRWGAAAMRLRAGQALLRRGDLDAATARLDGVRADGTAPLGVRLLARDVRAELAERRGRRADALRHLRAGLADLHAWQSSFGSLDLQTMVVGQGTRLAVRGLALAVDTQRPEVLFEWSERARMLASRVQPVRAPRDASLVADLAELREMAQAADGGRDAAPEREAELRRRVRERAWQHRGSGEVADPVSLAELREELGVETALVAYVVTAGHLVALVVTEAGVELLPLAARPELDRLVDGLLPDLDVAASDLPDSLAGFVRQELSDRLANIGRILVDPVLDAVGDRRVVLTPSGVLAGVPWTLLPGFAGRPLTVAQSATSWLARRATPLRTGTAGFVAGPRVARAEPEVAVAAQRWGHPDVLVGGAATAQAVSRLASTVDVLHVAAHGRHSAENPMFSGLELVDGPWFGYDIDQLPAVPDVVLLSACELGRSSVRWGEELIGMTTAWLHAGSRCVLASTAAVSDLVAHDVLVGVHEGLASGHDPAAALAAALGSTDPTGPPAPFVCFG